MFTAEIFMVFTNNDGFTLIQSANDIEISLESLIKISSHFVIINKANVIHTLRAKGFIILINIIWEWNIVP